MPNKHYFQKQYILYSWSSYLAFCEIVGVSCRRVSSSGCRPWTSPPHRGLNTPSLSQSPPSVIWNSCMKSSLKEMTWRTCKYFRKKLSFSTPSTTALFQWDRCCCSSRTGHSSQDDELHIRRSSQTQRQAWRGQCSWRLRLWFRISTQDESSSLATGKPCRLPSLPSWGFPSSSSPEYCADL